MNNPYLINLKKEKRKILIAQIILFTFFIIAWELLSKFNVIDSFLFSSPSKIFKTLIVYISNGEIFKHIFVSLASAKSTIFSIRANLA